MILCCGEALIDMIPARTSSDRNGFVPHSGGAIFNTAIALGRLGVETGFLTGLSNDFFGEQLAADLAKSRVDVSLAIRSDLPTTLAFVRLVEGHARYTFYDENTAGRCLTPEDLPQLPDSISALYFGGISLISEPCAEFYSALALQAAPSRVIMLDPNIRPGFIQNEAAYRERLAKLLQVADIVKVSDEDLDWISPGPESADKKAEDLLSGGVGLVIVTKGSDGATAFSANSERVSVAARKAQVVDTVGAGDTFNAGVLWAFAERGLLQKSKIATAGSEDLHHALSRGAEVASVTVARAGANPPWAHELEDAPNP